MLHGGACGLGSHRFAETGNRHTVPAGLPQDRLFGPESARCGSDRVVALGFELVVVHVDLNLREPVLAVGHEGVHLARGRLAHNLTLVLFALRVGDRPPQHWRVQPRLLHGEGNPI